MKRPELFVPLSVKLPRNPAIRRAGVGAELLFIRGLLYSKDNGNVGWIPDYDLSVVAVGLSEVFDVEQCVKALTDEEVWAKGDGGWNIPSWEKWNGVDEESAQRDEKRRKDAAARKRRQREREKEAAEQEAAQAPESSDPVHSDVTRDVTRDGRVTVTPVTELEIEEEIEKEPPLRGGVQPPLIGVVEPATAAPPRRAKGKAEEPKPNPHAVADQIAKDWYEANKTSTAQSFISVRQIVRPLVGRGIDPALVVAAVNAVTTEGRPISQGTLTVAMNRLSRSQTAQPDPYGNVTPIHQSPATRAASAAMERARMYAEAEGLTLAEALEA